MESNREESVVNARSTGAVDRPNTPNAIVETTKNTNAEFLRARTGPLSETGMIDCVSRN